MQAKFRCPQKSTRNGSDDESWIQVWAWINILYIQISHCTSLHLQHAIYTHHRRFIPIYSSFIFWVKQRQPTLFWGWKRRDDSKILYASHGYGVRSFHVLWHPPQSEVTSSLKFALIRDSHTHVSRSWWTMLDNWLQRFRARWDWNSFVNSVVDVVVNKNKCFVFIFETEYRKTMAPETNVAEMWVELLLN